MEKNVGKNCIHREDLVYLSYSKKLEDLCVEDIGIRFQQVRMSFDATYEDMSDMIGVSVRGLKKIEVGTSFPTASILMRLHELGVDIVWLLYGQHSPHMDLLSGLFSEKDDVRFDIFIRLYHYFITGNFAAFDNDGFKSQSGIILSRFFYRAVPIENVFFENEDIFTNICCGKPDVENKDKEKVSALPFYYKKNDVSAKAIGIRMREFRLSLGITIEAMAEKMCLSCSGYRKIEIGEAYPNGQVLFLLHDIFGVDIVWLLYGCHSTHSDILRFLREQDERLKFDVFVRLYGYFSSNNISSLVPLHGCCEYVEHFAKFEDDGLYTML